MEPKSDIMELAQKIEAAFLSQVREEELRAKRTLRVLQHQQEQIQRLQGLQQVQQNKCSSRLNIGTNDAHSNKVEYLMRPDRFDGFQATQKGSCESLTSASSHGVEKVSSEEKLIKKEMEYTKDVLLRSKSKIERLEKAVCGLQGSTSEVNLLAAEMSGWRSTIDNALLTIETTAMVDKRIWKTALQFFTPQEALHFLTAEKVREPGTLPINPIPN